MVRFPESANRTFLVVIPANLCYIYAVMSRLTRVSLMLALFFALDKGAAILRQVIIGRQFGLSAELDAFNVANNVPDLLYALISGGALAVAFIPVLSEVLTSEGRDSAWDLFSRIANLAFIVTGGLSILIALLAGWLVRVELGIAPGFGATQQALVVDLMRLNLLATLIFSISGLVMAGLQANQHFFLPALAPLLYNFGQIFGAVFLAPAKGYTIAGLTFPSMALGVRGLVYGVILGALLHLGVQIPGLFLHRFHWTPRIGLDYPSVQKVLRLMGPRLVTMLFIQLIFLVRDNLASRLETGAVTALTYGWMIQQVPETLIGTAIGTALLPTLAKLVAQRDLQAFQQIIERTVRILIALTIPAAVILGLGLQPLLQFAFGFNSEWTNLLLWATRGFLLGLVSHCLLEVAARAFYAQQDAITPMVASSLNLLLYVVLGSQLYQVLGAAGISLTDSLAYTIQAIFLLILLTRPPIKLVVNLRNLWRSIWERTQHKVVVDPPVKDLRLIVHYNVRQVLLRSFLAAAFSGGAVGLTQWIVGNQSPLLVGLAALAFGCLVTLPFIWQELRLLLRL